MIFAAEKFLVQKGIEKSKIHFELFTTPGQTFSASKKNTDEQDSGPKSKISIKVDGRSVDFDLGFDAESILDAALKNGADLPFACKGGVCCTCRAKLVEGEVRMDVNYALEPEEVEQGFILTCQSHPVTDKVVIDFDVK
jgi:ring-1,2-phenylacetyl-CoA epoxidase subunit PaaE